MKIRSHKTVGTIFKFIIFFLVLSAFLLVCHGEKNDEKTAESEILSIDEYLPEDIKDVIPDGIYSNDYDTVVDSLYSIAEASYLIEAIKHALYDGIYGFVKLSATLIGVVLLASIIDAAKNSMMLPSTHNSFSYIADTSILAVFISQGLSGVDKAVEYLEGLNLFIGGIVPATSALYAYGGNVRSAMVNSAGFMTFLSVSNFLSQIALRMTVSVCIALILADALSPSVNLQSISAFIKKNFVTVLSFVMMILLFSMSVQSSLSAASDSVSARTAKFVMGNMIPVVGNAVGDTVRTLGTSISFLRKTVGLGSVIIIAIMFIPHLLGLFMTRTAYTLSSAIADMLGCGKEKNILKEISGIYGYIIAVTSMCSVMFIFALTIFAGSAVAVSG